MTQPAQIEVPSVFGVPTLSNDGVSKTQLQKKYIEVRTYPLNFTNQDLTIGYRNGLKFTLPRQYDPDHQALIIRTELLLSSLIEINAQHLLSVADEHCSSEMRIVKSFMIPEDKTSPYKASQFGGLSLTIDYEISMPEIREYGGSVYFHDVDLMISHLPIERAPHHPYSEQGMLTSLCDDLHRRSGGRFGFSIEIVDNQGKIGDRYLNLGKHVQHIPAMINPRKMDGVYISWNRGVSGRLDIPESQVRCYPPEEADLEFNLFRSYGEAERFGNGDAARKEELAELEFSTTKLKLEMQADKAIVDRKNLQLEAALKELTHENEMLEKSRSEILGTQTHELEMERQKAKDYYETRSYVRKDSSEIVKVLPAIIMGIGAVVLALKAFF